MVFISIHFPTSSNLLISFDRNLLLHRFWKAPAVAPDHAIGVQLGDWQLANVGRIGPVWYIFYITLQ